MEDFNPEIEVEEIPFADPKTGRNKTIKLTRGDPFGFWTITVVPPGRSSEAAGVPNLPTGNYTSKEEAKKALKVWLDSRSEAQ